MSNNLDMVNVSKISVDVDNPNFIQDEESIVIYESIINQTNKSGKKKKIISKNTNKILKNSNSKPIISKKFTNLLNKDDKSKQKENKSPKSNRKNSNAGNEYYKNITFTPIKDFLSSENVYEISNAQTDYISALDEIYSQKIRKINDINKKYDNELFKLKGYVDGSNKENINNIIYNSVLKDKNEELNKIEKEFYYKKDYALSTYKERGENLKDIFKNEISKCLTNIKKEISSQLKQTQK